MQVNKIALMKTEQKELLIFLLVTFGLPFVMGIPLAILSMGGKDVSSFAFAQMFYPAAGLMLSKLICNKDKSLMPKTFFAVFLVLTGLMILWCFTPFFLSDQTAVKGINYLITFGSAIVLLSLFIETGETRRTHGIKGENWTISIRLLVLFVAFYFVRMLISDVVTGNLSQSVDSFSLSSLLVVSRGLLIGFIFTCSCFLGEEYGWRLYFQPLLQQKFGLIKGVILFGVLWEFWHLPLVLFYYAPIESIASIAPLLQLMLVRYTNCILLAIFMAYIYMRTHNVWLPIFVHFLNNNLGNSSMEIRDQETFLVLMVVTVLVKMVLFLPFLFFKEFRKSKADSDREGERQALDPLTKEKIE